MRQEIKSCISIIAEHINLRENKTISIQPIGVLGIEGHEFIEENVGSRSKAHGGAGMAGIGFEGGIDLCIAD